ncbi:ribonuclease P protein subunit p21 [Anopheles bellator]|uniref:ribonuclease P protein subunit p21 n=1 Tax=Anopheles bellator TaxID=139047 RepID=UPI0026494ED4|nr:ribonuclease P protein subunit p21 [Anopheles bellator]
MSTGEQKPASQNGTPSVATNDKKKQAKLCAGRETYERMNFLYQAATLMSTSNPQLAAYYGKLTKSVGKKAVLRMEPAIKRTLCVRCGVHLNPGFTADIYDYRHKKLCYLQVDCKLCGFSKRFYNHKNHQLWLDNPQSIVERVEFS